MTTAPTKPPRKRERSTSLTLTIPSALAAKLAADAKANVRTPGQQAVYVLLQAYMTPPVPLSDEAIKLGRRVLQGGPPS